MQKAQDPSKGIAAKAEGLLVGQKIPSYVKEFTKPEIASKSFPVKHSSILRVMAKWAEYLEGMFQKAEKLFKQRAYPYKTIDGQEVTLQNNNDGTPKLLKQLA